MSFALGDETYKSLARDVLTACQQTSTSDYWTEATRAEAYLLKSMPTQLMLTGRHNIGNIIGAIGVRLTIKLSTSLNVKAIPQKQQLLLMYSRTSSEIIDSFSANSLL